MTSEPTQNPCLFCKIINKEIPADIVYEDEHLFVLLDISPINEGHCLVIPKNHYINMDEIPDELMGVLFTRVKHTSIAVKKATGADGITNIINNGEGVGQIVFHSHIHIIPRHKSDGLKAWHSSSYENAQKKQEIFDAIQKEIN
jgi:histidine triad (HIT) family protein